MLIHGRRGALAAFVAAGLSLVNLIFAFVTLPESLPREARGKSTRRMSPLDFKQLRAAVALPGVGQAIAINFIMIFWFAGMEQTFRLFTEDGFGMNDWQTGRIFGLVGIVAATVQGGLIGRLSRRYGDVPLLRNGMFIQALAFGLLGFCPQMGQLRAGRALHVGGPHRLRQRPVHADAAGVRLAARRRRLAGRHARVAAVGLGAGARARPGSGRRALPGAEPQRALLPRRARHGRRRPARLAAARGAKLATSWIPTR